MNGDCGGLHRVDASVALLGDIGRIRDMEHNNPRVVDNNGEGVRAPVDDCVVVRGVDDGVPRKRGLLLPPLPL